jgi:hypothetical protein
MATAARETGRAYRASRFPSPLIDEAGANVRAPSHLRDHGPGLFNRRQNLRALLRKPAILKVRKIPYVIVNSEGFREILDICEGAKEDKFDWSAFLRHLVPQWRAVGHFRRLQRPCRDRRGFSTLASFCREIHFAL